MKRRGHLVCCQSWDRSQELLKLGHSLARSVGRATLAGYAVISHETAYKLLCAEKIAGGTLWQKIRYFKKRRKRYGSGRQRRGKIVGRVGIE